MCGAHPTWIHVGLSLDPCGAFLRVKPNSSKLFYFPTYLCGMSYPKHQIYTLNSGDFFFFKGKLKFLFFIEFYRPLFQVQLLLVVI